MERCPQCGVVSRVRLAPGEVCASCIAQNAWAVREGEKLVIGPADIQQAELRRAGEAAREKGWTRLAPFLLPAVCVALGVAAGICVLIISQPRKVGPLPELLSALKGYGGAAALLGAHAFLLGLIGLARLRKTRHFRRLSVLVPSAIGVVIGMIAFGAGGIRFLEGRGFPLRYASMPVNDALKDATPVVERIMRATAVVVAPLDKDGDGKSPALGTASVIAVEGDRAWLLTNSHVAMPYAAVAAWREADKAHPVWVQFADGRSATARVAWVARPPLDVVVLETTLVDPPKPVEIAPDSTALGEGAPVLYVPLPYRDGWMVHHGIVQRREEHIGPAGLVSLVYTTLPVQPGDSGSGLFDEAGRLVGINTWTRMAPGMAPQGISLPSETMRTIVGAIQENAMDRLDERLERPAPRNATK